MAKLSKLEKEAVEMMPEIVAGNSSEAGYVFKDPFNIAYLITEGLVEQNPEIVNGEELATRATQKGIDFVSTEVVKNTAITAEPKKEKVTMSFEIESNVFEKPKSKRGGGAGNSKYPFDTLEVGQSFFVAGKEAKSLGGTVSSANKRFAEEVAGETRVNKKGVTVPKTVATRKFEAYDTEKDGVKGTRIGRVAL